MELFKGIRIKRGRKILRQKASDIRRGKFAGNINSIKSIGIVWDASEDSEFRFLAQFHQSMADRGINVNIIGYYPGKILPDRLTAIRYLWCIKKEDLNFFYLPVCEEAKKFIKIPFDVLIDMNFNNILPLEYITALSPASLKIGLFNDGLNSNFFDLMLDIKKPADPREYLSNVIHYLEMIKNQQESIKQQI